MIGWRNGIRTSVNSAGLNSGLLQKWSDIRGEVSRPRAGSSPAPIALKLS